MKNTKNEQEDTRERAGTFTLGVKTLPEAHLYSTEHDHCILAPSMNPNRRPVSPAGDEGTGLCSSAGTHACWGRSAV